MSHLRCLGILLLFVQCKEPEAPKATANFFVENSGCVAPCYLYFYDQSTHAVAWKYEFGNGFNSNLSNDSMLYISPGTYTVKLSVWNSDNVIDSVKKEILINE